MSDNKEIDALWKHAQNNHLSLNDLPTDGLAQLFIRAMFHKIEQLDEEIKELKKK